MPVMIQMPAKKVIINNDEIKTILDEYDKALKSHKITDLQATEAQIRPGLIPTLENVYEKATASSFGAKVQNLPELGVALDDPAALLRDLYRDEWNNVITKQGLNSQHTEADEITNKFVLVRELLLRLITKALSKNQTGQGDGDNLVKIIDEFTKKINKNKTLNDNSLAFWDPLVSNVNTFIAFEHPRWIVIIQEMISTVKLLNKNTTAMFECLTYLKNIKYLAKCLIVSQFDSERKHTDLSENWIDSTFKEIEETFFPFISTYSEKKHLLLKPLLELLKTAKTSINETSIKKLQAQYRRIALYYEILAETKPLEDAIKFLDRMNTIASWLPFSMGLIQVEVLAERLKEHHNKCVKHLTLASDDPILKTPIGRAFIQYESASPASLEMGITKSYESLMDLQNKEVLSKITKFMEITLNELVQLQPTLGFKLLNEERLMQLTGGNLPLQPEVPKKIQADNNCQSDSKLISDNADKSQTSEEDLYQIETTKTMLDQKAVFLMENYGNEIRTATKSKKPTTEAILDWTFSCEKISGDEKRYILFLQLQLDKMMSRSLSSSSFQQISQELKQHELKDQKQILPKETKTLQTESTKKVELSLPIDKKVLKENELIKKEKELMDKEKKLMQKEKELAERDFQLSKMDKKLVKREVELSFKQTEFELALKEHSERKQHPEDTGTNLKTSLTRK